MVGSVTVYERETNAEVTPFDTFKVPVCLPSDKPRFGATLTVAEELAKSLAYKRFAERSSVISKSLFSSIF